MSVTLSTLIEAALTDRPYSQQRLGLEASRYARKITSVHCRDLPSDLHDEVFTQAFAELFALGASALAGTSGRVLFRNAVYAAMRFVRASNAPPGRRTRPRKDDPPRRVAAEDIGLIPDAATLSRSMTVPGDVGTLDFDRIEAPRALAAMHHIEQRLDAEQLLARAPAELVPSLRLVHYDDEPIQTVAAALGLSRFQLHRQFEKFYVEMRRAA